MSLFAGMRWKTKDKRLFAIRVCANDGNVNYSVNIFLIKVQLFRRNPSCVIHVNSNSCLWNFSFFPRHVFTFIVFFRPNLSQNNFNKVFQESSPVENKPRPTSDLKHFPLFRVLPFMDYKGRWGVIIAPISNVFLV